MWPPSVESVQRGLGPTKNMLQETKSKQSYFILKTLHQHTAKQFVVGYEAKLWEH